MKRGIDFLRVQDVPTTTAQSIKVCSVCDMSQPAEYVTDLSFVHLCNYSNKIAMVYLLQSRFALRISEALSISSKNITSKGSIVIKGLKGSNDKLIDIPELRSFFIECRLNGVNPFSGLSRFVVYRTYKKFLINCYESYGSKTAVTHGFRYAKVREVKEVENDLQLSSIVLGHKNINSTKHYDR